MNPVEKCRNTYINNFSPDPCQPQERLLPYAVKVKWERLGAVLIHKHLCPSTVGSILNKDMILKVIYDEITNTI